MSSNEDPSAGRDQEEKGTEEVEVGERSAEGGAHEAVGGGDGTTTDVAGVTEGGSNFWTRSMRLNKSRPGGCSCQRP